MARIYLDTNIFIYWFEANPQWAAQVRGLLGRMAARGDTLVTGWLTVGEILAKPQALGDAATVLRYERFFASDEVELVAFDAGAAPIYASLRGGDKVRQADALQLACAGAARCDIFVTNDKRLHKLAVSGIAFIAGLDRTP